MRIAALVLDSYLAVIGATLSAWLIYDLWRRHRGLPRTQCPICERRDGVASNAGARGTVDDE